MCSQRRPPFLCLLVVALCLPLMGCLELFVSPEEEELPTFAGAASPNAAALSALQSAVESDDSRGDATARRILALLRRQRLSAPELDLVRSFERVLAGRAILEGLSFELTTQPLEQGTRLTLELRAADGPLTLRVPPATLEHLRVTVDRAGVQTQERGSRLLDVLNGVQLRPGEAHHIELGVFPVHLGQALAVRESFGLGLVSGEVVHAAGTFPARRWPQPVCEVITRAPDLEPEVTTVEQLTERFVQLLEPEPQEGSDLLSLAVGIEGEQRGAALRALHAALRASPHSIPRPIPATQPAQRVLPALRWLARSHRPGVDLATWTRWLGEWILRDEQRRRERAGGGLLDLGRAGVRDEPDPRPPSDSGRGALDLP